MEGVLILELYNKDMGSNKEVLSYLGSSTREPYLDSVQTFLRQKLINRMRKRSGFAVVQTMFIYPPWLV